MTLKWKKGCNSGWGIWQRYTARRLCSVRGFPTEEESEARLSGCGTLQIATRRTELARIG